MEMIQTINSVGAIWVQRTLVADPMDNDDGVPMIVELMIFLALDDSRASAGTIRSCASRLFDA
jgi:hypothetical protein